MDSRRLSEIALSYARVIKQLREQYGHIILNHVDRVRGKSIRGAYCLCSPRQIAALAAANGPKLRIAVKDAQQPSLFDFGHHDE